MEQPKITQDVVDSICQRLEGEGWLTAAEIKMRWLLEERHMRAIAESSQGRILSGQKGYRLFDRTTPLEEADHAAAWLESQAKKMLARATAIRRLYHQYARPT